MKKYLLLFFFITLFSFPTVTAAQTLYGLAHQGSDGLSTLYTINTATGVASTVGPTGFERCGGMDFNTSGTLYATCERSDGSDTSILIVINTITGAGTEIGPTGFQALDPNFSNIFDVSFRNSDGALYTSFIGVTGGCVGLGTINPVTGAGTILGATNTCDPGNGIGFSPGDTLYHVDDTPGLYILNQTTGTASFVTATNFPISLNNPRLNALDYEPDTGILFASVNDGSGGNGPNYLGTIDTTTGNVSLIGQTVNGLDAIAFWHQPTVVPTMTEWGTIIFMVFLGLVSIYYLRKKSIVSTHLTR